MNSGFDCPSQPDRDLADPARAQRATFAVVDTEALDASFQERVRRNYDMLTEAVRLMGVVSGDNTPPPARRREAPTPEAPPAARSPAREERGFGLRGRLRLEPTPNPNAQAPAGDRLDWSDLIDQGSEEAPLDLDTPVMPAAPATGESTEFLGERLVSAIRRIPTDVSFVVK